MPDPTSTETPVEQVAPKVVFDEAQKERINQIVKEATARAGAEARAEVARLKEAADAVPQSTDTLLKLAEAQAELSSLKSEAQESKVRDVLHAAVAKQPFFDGELAAQICRASIKLVDGKPVVVDASGAPRLGPDFNPMTPADLAEELARSKPFMVRSTLHPGAGSVMATGRAETGVKLEDLFGRNSNGAAATRLGMTDMPRYKRLRLQAIAKGLL